MAARSVWKGYIRFGLVSLPVKAYTGTVSGGGGIALNQLHRECKSRIRYKKTCPIHGEVTSADIVMGYEFAKDQYVVIDTSELDKLRPENEKAIDITAFMSRDQIDTSYYGGKNYFLLPDGEIGHKPYVLLQRLMAEDQKVAVAEVVLFGREQIVAVRPVEGMLMMSILNFASDLRNPAEFADEVPHVEVKAPEMKMAKSLLDAMTQKNFDLAQFEDVYEDRLRELIESKVEGREIVTPAAQKPQSVANLMDALEKSLAAAKSKIGRSARPPKLAAPTVGVKAKEAKRRKSS